MKYPQLATFLTTSLLAAATWAQTPTKPLNLKLPPSDLPAASSTSAAPAKSSTSSSAPVTSRDAPGVYYGDTSGSTGHDHYADGRPPCDDSTYNKPQLHGSVGMGVSSGSHGASGNWQGGMVNLSQAFGSCDEPRGGVSISVGGSSDHFEHGSGRYGH